MDAVHKTISMLVARYVAGVTATLHNAVSSHRTTKPVTLDALCKLVYDIERTRVVRSAQLYIGSLDRQIVLSARLREGSVEEPSTHAVCSKKRGRGAAEGDVHGDRAADAVRRVRARMKSESESEGEVGREGGSRANGVGGPEATRQQEDAIDSQLLTAQTVMEALLRLRGTRGEAVVDSCGLSSSRSDDRPRLVLMCRLHAGVALSLEQLLRTLAPCQRDCVLACDGDERVDAAYAIPPNDSARTMQAAGQCGLTLHATVPVPVQK